MKVCMRGCLGRWYDNLYYGFSFLTLFNPVCLFIVICLNAFDVALMCFLHAFKINKIKKILGS